MTSIYLSSTYEDLKEYRLAVSSDLRKAGYVVVGMEEGAATDERPVEKSLTDLASCDLYVGLFAFRYGYIPPPEHANPNGLSITELEFRHAKDLGIPFLVFVASQDAPFSRRYDDRHTHEGADGDRIAAFKRYLTTECTVSFFSAPYQLASDVQAAVTKILAKRQAKLPPPSSLPPKWDISKNGSPFPGLMHFTRKYAEVFFGREIEVHELLDRMCAPDGRFTIVSGNSGSGKSSLVDAGVLPRFQERGVLNGVPCRLVRMVPSQGAHPFDALKGVLLAYVLEAGRDPERLSAELLAGPERFCQEVAAIIEGCGGGEIVLFLDQMEELFTAGGKWDTQHGADSFLSSLHYAAQHSTLRVIATLRGDFLHYCIRHQEMLKVLKSLSHYPLGCLPSYLLDDVIGKPARAAGLEISASLIRQLIDDSEADSGNLPLLAFVLQRLFVEREGNVLTEKAYRSFNGIHGVIEEQAGDVERELATQLGERATEQLKCLFQALVVINLEGHPTRRRMLKTSLPPALSMIADKLAAKRLLIAEGESDAGTVAFAHEKLFEAWPTLARWVADNRDDLMVARQAEFEALQWQRHGYGLSYLWDAERLKRLQEIIKRLEHCDFSSLVRQYSNPVEILIESLGNAGTSHRQRLLVGELLADLGDPRPGVGLRADGIPDIDWVPIPGGMVDVDNVRQSFTVAPFRISQYPTTNCHFQAFVTAEDGYQTPEWWKGLQQGSQATAPRWDRPNFPCENVSWAEATAYCRWMTRKYRSFGLIEKHEHIRLPTEWEWQQAATGGQKRNAYPWGKEWDGSRCNSFESGLNSPTAVGLYPEGKGNQPLDMCGNVWEWCLNKFNKPRRPEALAIDNRGNRAIRGGAWNEPAAYLNNYHRKGSPDGQSPSVGFRLALVHQFIDPQPPARGRSGR